jgi:hypothetical protein
MSNNIASNLLLLFFHPITGSRTLRRLMAFIKNARTAVTNRIILGAKWGKISPEMFKIA